MSRDHMMLAAAKRLQRYDWPDWTAQDIEDAERIVGAYLEDQAELVASRAEIARLRGALIEATHPDFIWGALDNVHDAETTLDDYADAVSRAQRTALEACAKDWLRDAGVMG